MARFGPMPTCSDAHPRERPSACLTSSQRRLTKALESHPDLSIGDCVPFYFCPRSVMLYVIHMANHSELAYRGGQGPILHLEADLQEAVAWAARNRRRWAFTSTNAAASYAEDYCDLEQLGEIDWSAVKARDWRRCRGRKQAEFLVEQSFPWSLVRRIGVRSPGIHGETQDALRTADHRPAVELRPEWYY